MRRSAVTVAVSAVLVSGALASCDFHRPGADAGATAWDVRTEPEDGAEDVPRAGRFVVQLDRLVLPRSVDPGRVRVSSGAVHVDASVRLSPARRQIWLDVDAERPLDADTRFLFEIDGLVDLDGNALATPYLASFRTGHELGTPPAEPVADARGALALLAGRCADASCHAEAAPAAGLDLSTYDGIARTAIGAVSRVDGSSATLGGGTRGALTLSGLRIIDVVAGRGVPATSLITYKLLGDPHVAGDPMPPAGELLSVAELSLLEAWIMAGAPDIR